VTVFAHPPGEGSPYRYDQGCRCAECRELKRVKRKRARDRARAANSPSYQRALAASRALKERYRGTCEECGAATSWAGGRDRPASSKRCESCQIALARATRVWTAEAVLDAICRYAAEHGRPPGANEWRKADPVNGYPAASSVYNARGDHGIPFPRWADAIEAAGFPRPQIGVRYRPNRAKAPA
jgi:hypothetical protein